MNEESRFDEIQRQGAELGKHSNKHRVKSWLDAVGLGSDFKPDIRFRPKRQAFLAAEKDMGYQVYRDRKKKSAKGEEGKKIQMSFMEAVFWAPVEPEYADLTKEFIEATATLFEERSTREHEVINIYWRLGYSLDPVLNFEDSEVTLRQVESRRYGVTWSGVGCRDCGKILDGADLG
jgi:hypothetical protein